MQTTDAQRSPSVSGCQEQIVCSELLPLHIPEIDDVSSASSDEAGPRSGLRMGMLAKGLYQKNGQA
ncbi:hypothetical protein C0Q70_04095 [Pomacea canaliculata]|uniref:Uncharacterized protein n=1 Tax=Pomacea canaliculata TaxID=400727 RepID=A0A2T7PUK5_POMCA|nr:hypothetical protein C0Q70_04095 [Pomacea canaliculata]